MKGGSFVLREDFSLGNGFTLVELLLVLTLSVLVMAAVATTFSAVVGAENRIAEVNARDRAGRVLVERISREIRSAVADADTPHIRAVDDGKRDGWTVRTTAYDEIRDVSYFWRDEVLFRLERDVYSARDGYPVPLRSVRALEIRFSDGTGWRDGWMENRNPRGAAFGIEIGETLYDGTIAL